MNDIDRDIQMAKSVIGKSNEYFKDIWLDFASGWDNAPCTEIACCISYMAGNLSKIYVSNYAEGLANMYITNNRFSREAKLGDFVFFDYGTGIPNHTGRVIDVTSEMIITVEGNIDNTVVRREYYKDSYFIYGYGHPLYDVIDDTISPEEFIASAILDIRLFSGMCGCDNMIKLVQSYLKDLGFYNGTVDGIFGSFTESAVKRYQSEHNLVVDGWVGYYTWRSFLND